MEAGTEKIQIFISYAHEDVKLLNKLLHQLAPMQRQGSITQWYDGNISGGQPWTDEIIEHLNTADIILLLLSPAIIASGYHWGVEIKRAMERQNSGEARVIPVILRPVMWELALFGGLQALPKDGRAITQWRNQDNAFKSVAEGIQQVVEELRERPPVVLPPLPSHGQSVSTYISEEIQTAIEATLAPDPPIGNINPPLSPKPVNGSATIEKKGSTMADQKGQQLGNYRLIRLLGQGGFANVYLGEHIYLGKRAAIKVMNTKLTEDGLQKFSQEAQTVARLEHPNIVKVLECGFADTTPFLVMDFAPYGSLRYPGGTALPEATVASYVSQIGAALQFAHDQGVIHRDVKPENLLVGKNNEILLSDFGIAIVESEQSRRLHEGIAGTVAYMAPEQLDGKARAASDQYALGIVVYEWLCGERPFRGDSRELVRQHLSELPLPLSNRNREFSPDIDRVVMKALAKNPEERYDNVLAFASALRHACSRSAFHGIERIAGSETPLPPPFLPDEKNAESIQVNAVPATVTPISIGSPPPGDNVQGEQSMSQYEKNQMPSQPGGSPIRPTISRRRLLAVFLAGGVVGAGVDRIITHWGFPPAGPPVLRTSAPLKLPYFFFGHFSEVNSVAWSPDGKHIASGSRDKTAKIWDVLTGQNVLTYTNHADWVNAVAWSHDGKRVVSGSADDTVQSWDATTGGNVITYTGHGASVQVLALSPDGTLIASGSYDSTVRVLNVASRHVLVYTGHTAEVDALAWSPDGKLIASGGGKIYTQNTDTTVQVWEAATGQRVLIYKGHRAQVDGLAWSPDGGRIASASYDSTVQVWDAATGSPTSVLTYRGHKYPVRAVAWSHDGKFIASASADHTVQVWDANTASTIFTYTGHHDWVHTVAWSPDSKLLASGSADRTIQIWELPK